MKPLNHKVFRNVLELNSIENIGGDLYKDTCSWYIFSLVIIIEDRMQRVFDAARGGLYGLLDCFR